MNDQSKINQAEADVSAFFVGTDRGDDPIYDCTLRPIRSLSNQGFVWVISICAVMFTIPLWPLLGFTALWVLLPHLLIALGLLWYFIRRNDKDRSLYEHIRIWPDLIAVHRHNPRSTDQYWSANPFWVKVKMCDTKTIESYLTLSGGGRTIEIGAFLSPDERIITKRKIESALSKL